MQSVKTHNPQPTYITAKNAITEETAKILIDLVDERGSESDWYSNPYCLEYQIANPYAEDRTKNDDKIIKVLPELFSIGHNVLRHINMGFRNSAFDSALGYHGFWILKYMEGGQFNQHCDYDSGPKGIRPPVIATASILLNDDFTGGETFIFDSHGKQSIMEYSTEKYSLKVWDGFTQHKVNPVKSGTRYALVIHYTGEIK